MGDEGAALGDNADAEVEMSGQGKELSLGAAVGKEMNRDVHSSLSVGREA